MTDPLHGILQGQIRERNVIRLGRTGIGRDRAYFSSFVLRSVTVSSRISLSFNLVSRLILHRLQGPGGHTQHNWTETFAENIFNVYFCFHPKRTNILQSKSSSSMSLIATSNHPFSCGLVPSSAIHCNRSTSVPIYCHLSFYIVTIAFTFNKLSYNQYNYYVI